MKTAKKLLPLAAALFAMPAMAQEAEAPKQTVRYALDATDSDFAFAMIAKSRTIQMFQGQMLLVDGTISLLQKKQDQWVLEIPAGDLAPSDLYVQGVTYDAKKGLTVHPVERFQEEQTSSDAEQGLEIPRFPGNGNGIVLAHEPETRDDDRLASAAGGARQSEIQQFPGNGSVLAHKPETRDDDRSASDGAQQSEIQRFPGNGSGRAHKPETRDLDASADAGAANR